MTVHVGLELSYSRRVRVYCTGFAQDGGRKWRGRGTASVGPATDSRRCPRRRCKKSICFRIGSRCNWQWPTGRTTSANAVTHKDSFVTLASTMSSERLCSSPAKHEGHDASFCIGCTVVDGLRSAVHTGADDERRGRSLLTIVRDGRNQMPWLSVRPSPSAAPERLCCAAPAPV